MALAATVIHYLQRGQDFWRSVQLLRDDLEYQQSTGLLSVHVGISLADAVLCLLAGERSRSEDHGDVIGKLESACRKERRDESGIRHLRQLLGQKHYFAYDDKRVTAEAVQKAVVHVERYVEWIFRAFSELRDEALQ